MEGIFCVVAELFWGWVGYDNRDDDSWEGAVDRVLWIIIIEER